MEESSSHVDTDDNITSPLRKQTLIFFHFQLFMIYFINMCKLLQHDFDFNLNKLNRVHMM